MSHFRIEVQAISRGKGRSIVAAAAYRSATKLRDERQGLDHDYQRKGGVERAEIIAPADAPAWATDRNALWNRADAAEKRKDAITGRELLLSLPRELGERERVELVRGFIRDQVTGRGIVADVAWHAPEGLDGQQQPHAHVLLTDRVLTLAGFDAKKDRTLSQPQGIEDLRAAWAAHVNAALARAQVADRVDHRSLERQRADALRGAADAARPKPERQVAQIQAIALDRPPEPKIGPVAAAMVRQGRGDQAHAWKDVRGLRQDREAMRQIVGQVIDLAKSARSLFQNQAHRLAGLGDRLETAMAAVRQRIANDPDSPQQVAADTATEAEWTRLVESKRSTLASRAELALVGVKARRDAAQRELERLHRQQPHRPDGLKSYIPGASARYDAARRRWQGEVDQHNKARIAALGEQQNLESYLCIGWRDDRYRGETVHAQAVREAKDANPALAKRMDGVRQRQKEREEKELEQRKAQTLERFKQQLQPRGPGKGRGR